MDRVGNRDLCPKKSGQFSLTVANRPAISIQYSYFFVSENTELAGAGTYDALQSVNPVLYSVNIVYDWHISTLLLEVWF